jgi:hypothetical protein
MVGRQLLDLLVRRLGNFRQPKNRNRIALSAAHIPRDMLLCNLAFMV